MGYSEALDGMMTVFFSVIILVMLGTAFITYEVTSEPDDTMVCMKYSQVTGECIEMKQVIKK